MSGIWQANDLVCQCLGKGFQKKRDRLKTGNRKQGQV